MPKKMNTKIPITPNQVLILASFPSKKLSLRDRLSEKSNRNRPISILTTKSNAKTQKEHFHLPTYYIAKRPIAIAKGSSMCSPKGNKTENPVFLSLKRSYSE